MRFHSMIGTCGALQLPVMVKGIEHTAIASPEPEELAQWYVEHLGFTINHQSKNSRTVFVKAADGSMIEIIEAGTTGRRRLDAQRKCRGEYTRPRPRQRQPVGAGLMGIS